MFHYCSITFDYPLIVVSLLFHTCCMTVCLPSCDLLITVLLPFHYRWTCPITLVTFWLKLRDRFYNVLIPVNYRPVAVSLPLDLSYYLCLPSCCRFITVWYLLITTWWSFRCSFMPVWLTSHCILITVLLPFSTVLLPSNYRPVAVSLQLGPSFFRLITVPLPLYYRFATVALPLHRDLLSF